MCLDFHHILKSCVRWGKEKKTKRSRVHTLTQPNSVFSWIHSGTGYPEVSERAEICPMMCRCVGSHLHT